jgi:hypothetical protein
MGAKKELGRSSSGRYVRNLGWKVTPEGRYAQHKFYLGCDETKARLAGPGSRASGIGTSRRVVGEAMIRAHVR